jgi:N-acetylmuramate 1-kinase
MKGMILAAGFGTRMLPVTRFVPKALLPAAGRPLLEWNLLHLAAHGVDEVVVNAHHLAEEMRHWDASLAARVDRGLPRVRLVVEPEILGTGGGIANAATWLDSDPVVVVNADQLFRPDLAAARRTHEKGRFLATLLCVRDPRHSQIRTDGLRATAIEPRPVFGDPGLLTFTGVYFLAHAAVEAIVSAAGSGRNAKPEGGRRSVADPLCPVRGSHFLDIISLFRASMAEGRLGVHLVENAPFLEAGSPEAYLELLRDAATVLPAGPTPPPVSPLGAVETAALGSPARGTTPAEISLAIHGFGVIEPGASVAPDAWIEESAVLSGAVVEPGARVVRSILGPGAVARGEVAQSIVAGHESLPIRLLPAPDEEPIAQLLARSWPETTTAEPAGPIIEASFPTRRPKGGVSLRLLQGDGSTRRIVRAVRGAESRILVLPAVEDAGAASIYPRRDGPGIPDETETFAYVAAHLERLGVPVPHIYALDPESRILVLEDLGDTLVYNLVLVSRTAAPGSGIDGGAAEPGSSAAALRDTYEEALDILLRMQAPPPEPFDPALTLNPDYDAAFILRFEAGYFLREMVRGHCRIEPTDPAGLEADFARAAQRALSRAPRVFMHRDYQSRNLMHTPRGLVVIDFQGARLGPPEYDLAALVLDPYANLPELLRLDLVEQFLDRPSRTTGERAAVRRRFRACGINRMLQTLGAFGYLGGRLGKPGFLEHAPAALLRLQELSEDEYPHLEALSGRVYRAFAGSG